MTQRIKSILWTLAVLLVSVTPVFSQAEKAYKVACIGFYNVENLFDTLDSPGVSDTEFTPAGDNRYTGQIYREKLGRLAEVISKMGTEITPDGPAILGVCEVENRGVLEDLVRHPLLEDRNYQIVHYDSRDRRGIDVGLLYQPNYFEVRTQHRVPLPTSITGQDTSWSRDILIVGGILDGEPFVITVNHWPSRRGGEKATAPLRNAAAKINRRIVDSLEAADPGIKVIIMGDLNDDPVNESVRKILRARGKEKQVRKGDMFNPMYTYFRRGIGTTAWRDAWSLFDQVIISRSLLEPESGFRYYKARVYNERYLTQRLGQFKGYPFRTFAGGSYLGGYSDHFPVYIFVIKEMD